MKRTSRPTATTRLSLESPTCRRTVSPFPCFLGHFNLNLQKGYAYTPPIFTLGKFFPESDRTLMSVALQVHHGVCDGFHACRFLNELQALLNDVE